MRDKDLKFLPFGWRVMRYGALMVLVLGGAIAPFWVLAGETESAAARLARLENTNSNLQKSVSGLSASLAGFVPVKANGGLLAGKPTADVAADKPIVVAQVADTANVNVRLDQLEQEARTLTGQVQGLQFQMTQLQTLLERMQSDTDARFTALEGGKPLGKTKAAPQAGGVTPAGEAPQPIDLGAPDAPSNSNGANPSTQGLTLGAPEKPLGTLQLDSLPGTGQPLDLSHNAGPLVTDADANAQYKAGYDAVVRGDYAFAEEQFRQFIALFPDHPQAPDATNWLGEALIQRGQYQEAADILLTGFQSYPKAKRAPDMLMKLGIALVGTGETDTACRTFAEVKRRYPDISPAFQTRLKSEAAKAKC